MSEILNLKKPYEISVWKEQLEIVDDQTSYFKEVKVAVIGSDTMTAWNKVSSPVLKVNTNGEKTLTFSLIYRYFDEIVGDFVVNPFVRLLVNERKVKLKYNNEWHDFVIKECVENSEDYVFEYTATDAFVQELSKNGYNVTFNADLNNNQGTITELAEATLKDSDWEVDEEHSDLLRQTISEPIYECEVTSPFKAKNLDTGVMTDFNQHDIIYVFYSYIANKITENVQFIRKDEINEESYDDNNALHLTNYRFLNTVGYVDQRIIFNQTNGISGEATIGDINLESQGYRLVYNVKTTYDPIMERTVNLLKAELPHETVDIYSYKDFDYSSTASVQSYVVNGSNFVLSSGTVKSNGGVKATGWSNQCVNNLKDSLATAEIVTWPRIEIGADRLKLEDLQEVVGYLQLQFPQKSSGDKYLNAFYNEGFAQNISLIDHIAKGDRYVFRVRYGYNSRKDGDPKQNLPTITGNSSTVTLRAVIARYKTVDKTFGDTSAKIKEIDKNNIIFDFDGTFYRKDNVIRGGELRDENSLYVIDGIVQTPSLKYVYEAIVNNEKISYVWDPGSKRYVLLNNYNFMPSYYTIAEAKRSISHDTLVNIEENLGLFIYDTNTSEHYVFIEDIALFKYMEDANGEIVFPGNAPEANAEEKEYFYLKPAESDTADGIECYSNIESLAAELEVRPDVIQRLYNDNCEKVLSIQTEHSNYFNILQTLSETFECWLKLSVEHEADGRIKLDENYKPIKKVIFKEFVGKLNYAGFKYGINLDSIERTVDSSEFVTKLIVGSSASDYTENGNLTIADARSNVLGESFILNFDYFLKQGLIERTGFNSDLNKLTQSISEINKELSSLNREYILASNDLIKIGAQRSTFEALLESANEELIKAIENYEEITNEPYDSDAYSREISKQSEKTKILEILYRIYTNAGVVNSYSGIITSVKQEYNSLNLKCNGAETFTASIVTSARQSPETYSTKLNFNNYFEGFKCDFLKNHEVIESFESGINTKFFNSDNAYDSIVIRDLPKNYHLEYYNNGAKIICDDGKNVMISIYDGRNPGGITRKIQLVPNVDFAKNNTGLKQQIKELEDRKQKIINKFNFKYSKFIQEGTWESNEYINPELYYLDAVQVSNTSAQPKVTYTINVAEISEVEGYENYNFDVGDKTYIEDTHFFGSKIVEANGVTVETPIKEEVIVSEIEWNLDDPTKNVITVQNYKTQFEDLFQRINATVQSVEYNTASYSRAASIFDENGNINTDLLVSSLQSAAGSNYNISSGGAVRATREGLLVRNLTSPENCLIIKSGGIERSTDGGRTWENIISAEGMAVSALKTGTIDTTRISIMDGDNPSFRWDPSGLSAFGYEEDGAFDLTTFVRFDKYGLYGIKKGGNYVVESLDDIKDKAHFGITWDGFFIKNSYTNGYVSISSDNDFQVMRKIDAIGSQYYELTEDEDIVAGKQYYVFVQESGYTLVEPEYEDEELIRPNESELPVYYEFDENNQEYVLTEDTEIVEGKDYYTFYQTEDYVPVDDPIVEDIDTYYENIKVSTDDYVEKIKIGALDFDEDGKPIRYGINIRNDRGDVVLTTDDNGDLTMSGTIYASAGHIGGMKVNNSTLTMDTIVLEPNKGIYSTNIVTIDGIEEPVFLISDEDGSAIFNDITARGHIDATSGTLNNLDITGGIVVAQNGYMQSSNWDDTTGSEAGWQVTDTSATFNSVTVRGTVYANAGEIGGMIVDSDKLRMDHIILEPGVGIYSDYGVQSGQTNYPFIISDTSGKATFRDIEALGGILSNLLVKDTITVGDNSNSGLIKSQNYTTGTSGWAIKSDGSAEFQNATVRGHIDATSGTLSDLDITGGITVAQNGYVKSNNYNAQTNTGWQITDSSATFNNVTVRGHVEANTGTLNNLSIIGGITVNQNGYIQSSNWSEQNNTGWKITDTGATFNNVTARGHIEASTGTLGDLDVIDTITVGDVNHSGTIQSYGYTAGSSGWAIKSNGTAEFQNAIVRGEVNAGSGNFYGMVTVGKENAQDPDYIMIDGQNALIRSANYSDGAGTGWLINNEGDAYFNNITARGAIKTAVFEYAEIQAVGGIFIFRPSSTIRSARISGNDLILKVEKPLLFAKISYNKITSPDPSANPQSNGWYERTNYGYELTEDTTVEDKQYYSRSDINNGSWCKISNYLSNGAPADSAIQNILLTNGLTHVYQVSNINTSTNEVTLEGAAAFVSAVKQTGETDDDVLKQLEGGALVDMGRKDGSSNYGIGVNSSDNTVNLPARAISLFETEIDETKNVKVTYNYRGILGTLPTLPATDVFDTIYNSQMAGTQGIYTDNMYIGDRDQYIAFYEDDQGNKQLRIKANQIVYEIVDEETGETDWQDITDMETTPGPPGPAGQDAIRVEIDPIGGNFIKRGQVGTSLIAHVYEGINDITNQFSHFTWYRRKADGTRDTSWSTQETSNQLSITTADVDESAVFVCEVTVTR